MLQKQKKNHVFKSLTQGEGWTQKITKRWIFTYKNADREMEEGTEQLMRQLNETTLEERGDTE